MSLNFMFPIYMNFKRDLGLILKLQGSNNNHPSQRIYETAVGCYGFSSESDPWVCRPVFHNTVQ